ncbi:MAG: DUF1667 domain-containing protein [Chloroflexota bacterium]|jgi:CxxC motif-containing protein
MVDYTKIICITCPKGCTLEVTLEGKTVVQVKPHCKRGHEYAQNEITDPRRMIATTVRVTNGIHPLLPVYTAKPFPKGQIMELQKFLREVEVSAPIKMDSVIVENALGSGIDIIASRDMAATS